MLKELSKCRVMEDWKKLCSHAGTEGKIVSHLEETGLSSHLKKAVLKEIIKPTVDISNLEETVYTTISNSSKSISLTS